MPVRITRAILYVLDWLAARTLPPEQTPPHQLTGRRGEEAAYFYLRKLGYIMVARNHRVPNRRGEIDLIAWDKDVLCFIEVKTRTTRDIKPAEAAVDRDKQRNIAAVARDYLRKLPPACPYRFDVISVYFEAQGQAPSFELFRNVSAVA